MDERTGGEGAPAAADASVSVAMCTYNGARYVGEQLASIAAQTLAPCEIVVCDDGSDDGTESIVEAFAAEAAFPVRLHRNQRRMGAARNFEQSAGMCAGAFVALADQDDVWLSRKLDVLHTLLRAEPDAAFAFCDAWPVDAAGQAAGERSLIEQRFTIASVRRAFARGRELDLVLKRDFVYGTTLMYRRALQPLLTPVAEGWSYDSWVVNVLTLLGMHGVMTAEPLVFYRQHGEQTSGGLDAPKAVPYPARVAAYEALRTHLDMLHATEVHALPRKNRARLEDKLRYLRALARMEGQQLPLRAVTAAGEVLSRRWWKYSPRRFR